MSAKYQAIMEMLEEVMKPETMYMNAAGAILHDSSSQHKVVLEHAVVTSLMVQINMSVVLDHLKMLGLAHLISSTRTMKDQDSSDLEPIPKIHF